MKYDYRCPDCGKQVEKKHPMNEDPTIVCECGTVMKRVIYGGSGVIFKGNGWTTKSLRVKSQMAKRREKIKGRQLPKQKLVPNIGGEVMGSWIDAAHEASRKGLDPSGYVKKAIDAGEKFCE